MERQRPAHPGVPNRPDTGPRGFFTAGTLRLGLGIPALTGLLGMPPLRAETIAASQPRSFDCSQKSTVGPHSDLGGASEGILESAAAGIALLSGAPLSVFDVIQDSLDQKLHAPTKVRSLNVRCDREARFTPLEIRRVSLARRSSVSLALETSQTEVSCGGGEVPFHVSLVNSDPLYRAMLCSIIESRTPYVTEAVGTWKVERLAGEAEDLEGCACEQTIVWSCGNIAYQGPVRHFSVEPSDRTPLDPEVRWPGTSLRVSGRYRVSFALKGVLSLLPRHEVQGRSGGSPDRGDPQHPRGVRVLLVSNPVTVSVRHRDRAKPLALELRRLFLQRRRAEQQYQDRLRARKTSPRIPD